MSPSAEALAGVPPGNHENTRPKPGIFVVPGHGFEPWFTASKAAVLPLDDPGVVIWLTLLPADSIPILSLTQVKSLAILPPFSVPCLLTEPSRSSRARQRELRAPAKR